MTQNHGSSMDSRVAEVIQTLWFSPDTTSSIKGSLSAMEASLFCMRTPWSYSLASRLNRPWPTADSLKTEQPPLMLSQMVNYRQRTAHWALSIR